MEAILEERALVHAMHANSQKAVIAVAREDPSIFVEYVLRDEKTGKRIEQAPLHDEWQTDLSTKDRCVIWAHVEAGKTNQITIGRVLWELGKNQNLRVVVVSKTLDMAKKIVRTIGQYIKRSEELHRVFPQLRPTRDKSLPWNQTMLTVEREVISKDPSVQACGAPGNIIGSRTDLLIVDDALTWQNTRTPSQLEEMYRWVKSTPMGRLTEEARVWFLGNAWHPKDVMHRIAEEPGVFSKRYPVMDAAGNLMWPKRWSKVRIAQARRDLGPLEFARQLLCIARDDAEARFKREWMDECIRLGKGYRIVESIDELPDGFAVFTGVDLAVQKHASADWTCFFTVLLHPDGTRQVLNIQAGKWNAPEIVAKLEAVCLAFGSIAIVENVGAQDYILQFARKLTSAVVRPFTTGLNKVNPDFGLESLGVEMAAGKWLIPNRGGKLHPEVDAWLSEMLFYNPKGHTGDRLMACLPPGQLVTTERGLVPIERVQAGDRVLTHRARWREVTGTTSRPWEGSLVEVKARGMNPLLCTPEHPVWSADAWYRRDDQSNRLEPVAASWAFRDAQSLRAGRKDAGMYVYAPAAAWEGQCPIQDAGLAFLVGLYLAEGWCGDHQVSFGLHEKETYLHALITREAMARWGARTSVYTKRGSRGVSVTVHSTQARAFFQALGKRQEKCLPWAWMSAPVDLGLHVVRGWLAGDGSLSTQKGLSHLRGVSVSPGLLYQMRQFLWLAKLSSNLAPFRQSGFFQGQPTQNLPAWVLSLSSSDSARLLSAPTWEETQRWGTPWRTPRERSNGGSLPAQQGALLRLASLGQRAYSGLIYNLHVAEDESFVAEGLAVHNSWFAREGCRNFERRHGSRAVGGTQVRVLGALRLA